MWLGIMLRRKVRGPGATQILQMQIKILHQQPDAPARRKRENHRSLRRVALFKRDRQQR